ncbi:MAG TPA: hypothetical protein DDX84_04950 [Nitrospiraceae bacterium]|nr:MAG: hypothetical protein A2Z60_04430 [Nitrospirae bacterium RIFCSPLOWO2_02_42_7]OGW56345.1 MAG: hypothetical protein A3D21_07365 [Nitrospirae bacterium RIFCSPHIGHO2_02_FULL_42_12]HBI23548.1 hypothetical protein [Nitrospiraceae bacterium]
MSIEDILLEIRKRETFLITTHVNPEGDAIGSSLALALALSSIGKKVEVITQDPVPKGLKFLPSSDTIKQAKSIDRRFDAVITVDCGDLERVGFLKIDNIPGDILINIDHHVTNKGFGAVNFVEDAVASAQLIYDIMKRLNISLTPDIATCIYTAIMTETGSFRYSNTTSETFKIAQEMVSAGAMPWNIAEQIFNRNNIGRIKLLGLILESLDRSDDGKISWITVKEQMYRETGTSKEDVEDFINFPRSIEGVEVAILFRESNQGWKISLRSNGKVDVSNMALEFGGGGHSMAAGFFIQGGHEEVKKRVVNSARSFL